MQYNTYKGSTTITSFKISCVLYEILIIFIFTIFYSIFKFKITHVCTLKKKIDSVTIFKLGCIFSNIL